MPLPRFLPALLALPIAAQPASAELDAYVLRALRTFATPGAAVAIVRDGKLFLAKGYGVRRLGDPAPVTEHTRFQVASNTKAFTSALLAQFVDEKKLRWEDRVIDHLPGFRLKDPYVTRELTVRDLLTHRSGLGLGAGDLLWFRAGYGREEILRRFREVPPVSSFRSTYAYDNVLYIAAGEVAAALGGKPFESLLEERLLRPLGMESATPLYRPSPLDASPHAEVDGHLQPVAPDRPDAASAAAGLQTSVTDLAKWVVAQLAAGRLDGDRRIFSEARSKEMWSAVTPTPIREPSVEAMKPYVPAFAAYGLGWELRDYRGVKLVSHTGGLTGTTSRVLLVPERGLGIIVLTNGETRVWDAIAWHILDRELKAPPYDWVSAFKAAQDAERTKAAEVERRLLEGRAPGATPAFPPSTYAGSYRDAWYGDATLSEDAGGLVLRFLASPSLVGDLSFWQAETFRVRWRDRTVPDAFLTFTLDENGKPAQFTMKAVSPLADFSFNFHELRFRPHPAPAP